MTDLDRVTTARRYLCELHDDVGHRAWCWLLDVKDGQIVRVAETGDRPWRIAHCWPWHPMPHVHSRVGEERGQ
jgi:hypothetical protein